MSKGCVGQGQCHSVLIQRHVRIQPSSGADCPDVKVKISLVPVEFVNWFLWSFGNWFPWSFNQFRVTVFSCANSCPVFLSLLLNMISSYILVARLARSTIRWCLLLFFSNRLAPFILACAF